MSKIFISYSHVDKDFVEKLVEHCQKANIDVWLDNNDLKAGESWTAQIDEAITNASAMILILSPSSSVSPYVTYEWAFAKGLGKKIIPVICESINRDTHLETEIDRMKQQYWVKLPKPQIHPYFIIVSHYIDLSVQNNTPQNWQKLISQIREVLGNFLLTNLSPYAPDEVKIAYTDLKSSEGIKRNDAILSLSLIKSPYAEDALILALDHEYPDVRYWSAEKLGKKRSIKAIPALIKCVSDENDDVRGYAVEALIKIGDKSIGAGLIQALGDGNDSIKRQAAKAIGDLEIVEAVPSLIKLLEDTNQDTTLCQRAVEALGKIGSDEVVPDLINMLQHQYAGIRKATAKALGDISGSRAIAHLVNAHKDADWEVKKEVVSALQKIKLENIPYLLETIEDGNSYSRNRQLVVSILQYIGEKAVPYLIESYQHGNDYIKRGIISAMERIPEAQEELKRIRG
jgi:HEAT repeat protein